MNSQRGRALGIFLLAVSAGLAFGQTPPPNPPLPLIHLPSVNTSDQFLPPGAPPENFVFDNVGGEIVNFETMMAKPIIVTSDGDYVIVANEADNRLVVLTRNLQPLSPPVEIPLGQGICAIAERKITGAPSEIWVTMRHQAATVVIDSATWMITHVVRPTINPLVAGARFADCPSGIAFSADRAFAYIASSNTDHVAYYDAATKLHLGNIPLKHVHNGTPTHMNEPFAMTRIGNLIAVASYRSGNQSLTSGSSSALPAATSRVEDLTNSTTKSLPDFDVMLIDPATQSVVAGKVVRGCGTVLNGIAAIPALNKLVVSNTEAKNAKFVGEGSFAGGKVVDNRVAFVDLNGSPSITVTHVVTEGAAPFSNVVLPTDIAVSADRVFVAGYGSSNIGILDHAGSKIGHLTTESGPLGLAYSARSGYLYCYNRAAATVTGYTNVGSGVQTGGWNLRHVLVDPTFDIVKTGRQIFLDPSHSGSQTTSCASCHLHLRNDGTTWNLSGFYDAGTGFTDAVGPSFWKDIKGTMQTQSLQSLEEIPGYHWRGEQKDLEAFNDAFVGLLKAPTKMADPDFQKMKQYIFSAHYPANPFQMMNRDFSGSARTGAIAFRRENVDEAGSCHACHTLPLGSKGSISNPLRTVAASDVSTKTPQLRGLWEKTSDLAVIDIAPTSQPTIRAMTGSSLVHTGAQDGIADFINKNFLTTQMPIVLHDFLNEFDSGVAPSANFCEWLDAPTPGVGTFLETQVIAGHCDLAVRGWWKVGGTFEAFGWYWDRNLGGLVSDDPTVAAGGVWSMAQLAASTSGGNARWLLLGVPLGSGQRIGVDRDRDGKFDREEMIMGTNPANPDTDGDGYWDGYEGSPLIAALHPLPMTAPVVVSGTLNATDDYTTTKSIKITYRTNQPSPTRVIYGKSGSALNDAAGDQFPLPLSSNLWKRDHTVFIRLTDANQAYDFKVETQGQNGMTALSALITKTTQPDVIANGVIVDDVVLTSGPGPTGTTWTATVTITDRLGVPVLGAVVNGVFTEFTAGTATSQIVVASAATDFLGQTTLSWNLTTTQAVGDGMAFTVPMVTPKLPGGAAGSVPGVQPSSGNFIWPESKKTSEKVIL